MGDYPDCGRFLKKEISCFPFSFPFLPGQPQDPRRMSSNDYHARLSAHLSRLLTTHLDTLTTVGQGSMVTDLEALKARDREHARAWMTEGYARYVGGVNEGFELHPEDVARGGSRKRRYTEGVGVGLLERRGRLAAFAAAGGAAEGSALSDAEEDEGRSEKRQRIGPSFLFNSQPAAFC